MADFLLAAPVSALLCALLLPPFSRVGVLVGAVDLPDGGRKFHAHPTPRFSGPALYAAVAIPLLFLPMAATHRAALLSGGALTVALGVTDDAASLSPRLRLLAEAALAFLPVALGLYPRTLWLFGLAVPLSDAVAVPLAMLWVMTLTNAYNLIDGLDGLCATQGAAAALLLFLSGAPAALLLLGACFGFLPYNRQAVLCFGGARRAPTAAFLGDGGALLIGYLLSVLSLMLPAYPLLPLFFFVPLYDLVTSVLRRLRARQGIFTADGRHLHHRLLGYGLSAGGAVTLLLLISLFCGGLGLWGFSRL